jgi:aryl-alcohol dehydrogenase-like predicted oxidoreductase
MEYRTLGRTGLPVSVLGIGTWQLSGPLDVEGRPDGYPDPGREQVIRLVRDCHQAGINLIDSAEIYGDGEGERRVGEAVRGRRDEWIVVTKFGQRRGPAGKRIVNVSPGSITESLEGSLKRLRSDYVDIYLYHTPPDKESLAAGLDVLERLRKQGKLRFIGVSTTDVATLRRLTRRDEIEVVMLSQSLVTHPADMLELVRQRELGCLVRGALEQGRLSGKYFGAAPCFPAEDVRSRSVGATELARYAVYRELIPEGSDMVSLALRYLLDFDSTHTIVLGARSMQDYQRALRALQLPRLDQKSLARIRELREQLSALGGHREPLMLLALRRITRLLSAGFRSARRVRISV